MAISEQPRSPAGLFVCAAWIRSHFPLVPAKAGTQFLALDSRLRGNERSCGYPAFLLGAAFATSLAASLPFLPEIGSSISRWPAAAFFLPFAGLAAFASAVCTERRSASIRLIT